MTLHEPAVALTDFGLALECGLLFWWPLRRTSRVKAVSVFFFATGMAALLGGVVHGFFPDESTFAYIVYWRAALISIGLAASAAIAIGAKLCLGESLTRALNFAAGFGFIAYGLVVWFVRDDFVIAIYAYTPAAIFLLICFGVALQRTRDGGYSAGMIGILLTFVAAAVQRSMATLGVLDHNALYHVCQAVALVLIFVAARIPARQMASVAGEGH